MHPESYSSPFDQGFAEGTIFSDPYPIYRTLQNTDPVHWSKRRQTWVVTRHDDVSQCLQDNRLTVKREGVQIALLPYEVQQQLEPLKRFYSSWLMYLDPPDHTRIRKVVSRAFTRRRILGLLQHINEKVVRRLSILEGSDLEVLSGLASPLSIEILLNALEIPEEALTHVEQWSQAIVNFMQGRFTSVDEASAEAYSAVRELGQYLTDLLSTPSTTDGLIHLMQDARKAGILSDDEIIPAFANILIDGHEPIANAIANGLLALIQNPSEMMELRSNPFLIENGVEELLRYDPPFQYSVRHASSRISIDDKTIEAGQRLLLLLGAANRDPRVFHAPDKLEVSRQVNLHRSFGFGTHFCLGAFLARPILTEVFREILSRYNTIELRDKKIERHQSLGSRGLKSLEIQVS